MPHVALVFASSYGQTRAIVAHLADRLTAAGASVTVVDLGASPDAALPSADHIVLASGVYSNQHHEAVVRFARAHAGALDGVRTSLVSVSLAAAIEGDEGEHMCWDYISEFSELTGFEPGEAVPVAGALAESAYDPATRALLRVATWRAPLGISGDVVLTDEGQLDALATRWAAA